MENNVFISKEELQAQGGCMELAIGYELATYQGGIDWEDEIITDDKITLLDIAGGTILTINIERVNEGLELELIEE